MDYMTKWVEKEALPNAIEEVIIKFIFKLFVRYGLPREVIIDGGVTIYNSYNYHHPGQLSY
jgi:hypothetical protein